MPSFTVMPKEGLSLPRVSVSVFMIIRLLLLCITLVIMAVVGYYFSYYQGSYRNSLFHEELMLLVCSVAVFINSLIMVIIIITFTVNSLDNILYFQKIMSSMTLSRYTDGQVNLSSSYVEVIACAVNSFLLIISGIVLLIQVK